MWKQLIDSPTFSQLHLSVQTPRFIVDLHEPNKYLVVDPWPDPLVHNLSKLKTENYLHLVGTLHGVVCLYDFENLVLWNPSLRKFSTRPFPNSYFIAVTSYGFWIDPSTKDFKAIMLQQWPFMQKCIMYSSIRDGWSEIPAGKIGAWNLCREGPPVIVGGAAHWGGCLHKYNINAILSFDFVQESFDIVEMPYLHNSRGYSPCRWQGTLSFVRWDGDFPRGFEIYSRQEDSWVKMVGFKVELDPYLRVFWAMEDVEARKKKRNRKKDVEIERICDLSIGEKQENIKVLATTTSDGVRGELFLHGTKTGRTTLML